MQLEEFDIEFLALKMSENPQSMLFARLADLYLTKEQPVEAMKLLEEGSPGSRDTTQDTSSSGKLISHFRNIRRHSTHSPKRWNSHRSIRPQQNC